MKRCLTPAQRATAVPPAERFSRRRLLGFLGAGAGAVLAACDSPGRRRPLTVAATPSPPPPPTPPPPATPTAAPPPAPVVIEPAEPQPIVREIELVLSWPPDAIAALAQNLGRTGWRASVTRAGPAAIDRLAGPAATADLVSPADPRALAAEGRLRALPPAAGRAGWHPAALATGNLPDQSPAALPLALAARLFTYRSDLLRPPPDLPAWRLAAAAAARHGERYVRFAGIDLTPAAHDPRWLVFAGPECGPGECYSRRSAGFFRSLFADPGIAFRRDHPRTEWPPSALAAGAAASGLEDWARTRRLVRGTPLQGRLATAPAPFGLNALEGGGRLWLAAPAESEGAGPDALAEFDLPALGDAVAAALDLLPSSVRGLADRAAEDANLAPLLDLELRLYDWRPALGPDLGALAGVTHRALALGPRPVGEVLDRFERAVAQSRG